MLTDIFAYRYANRELWSGWTEAENKLLVQCFRLVSEQVLPYSNAEGKPIESARTAWQQIHDRLSMELGLEYLSPQYTVQQHGGFYEWTPDWRCRHFVLASFNQGQPPDRFIKERISLIELAMRSREEELTAIKADLPARIARAELGDSLLLHRLRLPGSQADGMRSYIRSLNQNFSGSVDELNERFRRAGAPLNYHNGFIQIVTDQLVESRVEGPFWKLVADPKWNSVDRDMKEALDLRDANAGDPALYAAKALESAIKIISDSKGWTRGAETGAAAYIDNLVSQKNGSFVRAWEGDALKMFFKQVRNPLGHGTGNQPPLALTSAQTDWAIETCMVWIRSLLARI